MQNFEKNLLINKAEKKVMELFRELELIRDLNQEKVLCAFQDNRVAEEHFYTVSGYGHDDRGRKIIDKIYAQIFNCEAALVRNHFVSGTHSIACGFFGNLRHGDKLVSVAGRPYDTLEEVIGLRGNIKSSLKGHGVEYAEVPLKNNIEVDLEQLEKTIDETVTMAFLQRSRGYSLRKPLDIENIAEIIAIVKKKNPECICFVDNCYGEFTEALEPTDVGADLMAGSLIKNPGGGIVETGGYIAGRKKFVDFAADRLTAPGIGAKGGAMLNQSRLILQGLFMAPGIVHEALKGAILASQVFLDQGYKTTPLPDEIRSDIIQAIIFEDREKLIKFCKTVQYFSPVDSYLTPVPDEVPGYEDQIIMAAGTFIEGSTIELSADGPLREPYVAYMQGGLNYAHIKLALNGILSVLPNS
ncbi:MAG TPA: methionine gamma-lyase family protein [Candidatus Gastranaerophilales bacterium]|nr:methionine gamma-lyase family protein [Candidatus Gastranaerophilales bacterium]